MGPQCDKENRNRDKYSQPHPFIAVRTLQKNPHMPSTQAIADRFNALPGPVRAGFWISLTAVTFTSMMTVARMLAPDLHVFVIVFFRAIFGLCFLSPLVFQRRGAVLSTTKFKIFAFRGVTAYLSLVGYFFAAALIPLADIAAIGFTRPVFGCIAAILILGEIARTRRWAAIGIGLIGALIVVRPGFVEINPGILWAFGAVAMTVCNTIMIKYLSRTEHPDTIALYQGICMAPLALIAAIFVWTTPTFEQFFWLLVMGAFGACTQRTLSRAYAAADATVVIVLDFLRLPIAAAFGLVLFNEWPVIWVWVGGAVIVASSILLTQREVADKEVNITPPPKTPD
jgi:drug/metabolite transporter (DMT)-like permease